MGFNSGFKGLTLTLCTADSQSSTFKVFSFVVQKTKVDLSSVLFATQEEFLGNLQNFSERILVKIEYRFHFPFSCLYFHNRMRGILLISEIVCEKSSTPNKPVPLPRNQLLIRYAVTSPVHTVMIRGNVTSVYPPL